MYSTAAPQAFGVPPDFASSQMPGFPALPTALHMMLWQPTDSNAPAPPSQHPWQQPSQAPPVPATSGYMHAQPPSSAAPVPGVTMNSTPHGWTARAEQPHTTAGNPFGQVVYCFVPLSAPLDGSAKQRTTYDLGPAASSLTSTTSWSGSGGGAPHMTPLTIQLPHPSLAGTWGPIADDTAVRSTTSLGAPPPPPPRSFASSAADSQLLPVHAASYTEQPDLSTSLPTSPFGSLSLPPCDTCANGLQYTIGGTYEGYVKRYNPARGFGFLTAFCACRPVPTTASAAAVDYAREAVQLGDIFIHQSNVRMGGFRSLPIGGRVRFSVGYLNGHRSFQAVETELLPQSQPPRAALRERKSPTPALSQHHTHQQPTAPRCPARGEEAGGSPSYEELTAAERETSAPLIELSLDVLELLSADDTI